MVIVRNHDSRGPSDPPQRLPGNRSAPESQPSGGTGKGIAMSIPSCNKRISLLADHALLHGYVIKWAWVTVEELAEVMTFWPKAMWNWVALRVKK